ncbi:hypothetical protein BRADI_3g30723v3 [Brachypodium distachyon]|uniref:Uncharacterized protein n=1 Tax=Brachypodium distachyon TaxID=15368 RepID=A0A0Q3FCM3_BRADI|nr:hypothetical protein BRADI_3g30723v3 [Brachypodium distachyon]
MTKFKPLAVLVILAALSVSDLPVGVHGRPPVTAPPTPKPAPRRSSAKPIRPPPPVGKEHTVRSPPPPPPPPSTPYQWRGEQPQFPSPPPLPCNNKI